MGTGLDPSYLNLLTAVPKFTGALFSFQNKRFRKTCRETRKCAKHRVMYSKSFKNRNEQDLIYFAKIFKEVLNKVHSEFI